MSDTHAPAPSTDEPAPTVAPRVPLPGIPIRAWDPLPWYGGPAFPGINDVLFHVRYRQAVIGAGHPVRQRVGYLPEVAGKDVRTWLRGALRSEGWSEAAITEDGTLHYRKTKNHAALRFTPDPSSDRLLTAPGRQVTADAYRVTGNDRPPRLWTPGTLRAAVTYATAPGAVDWPDGWAHITDGGTVTFAGRGFPWSGSPEYTAEPAHAPADWGPKCGTCRRHASEHPEHGTWGTRCDTFRAKAQAT
ncbi:hypothetical protein ACFV3E_40765 [Streptomyces sp. NPDC059718]